MPCAEPTTSKWSKRPLSELLVVQNGFAFSSKKFSTTDGTPLIRIRDLNPGTETKTRYLGEFDEQFLVHKGDLLIGMDGEFRCNIWKGQDALLNQRVCRLQNFSSDLIPKFLFYGINKYLKEIEDVTGFTTVKHLSSKSIKEIKFPVPPLAEQERIVGILDEAFEGIAAATAQAEKNLHNARELFQSVLQSTFSQKGDDWEETTLGDEVEFLAGFAFKSSEYTDSEDGIRLLRGDNIIQGEFRWEGVKRWPKVKAAEYAKFELAQNDVVLAMDRPWVTAGLKVASIEENDLPCLQVQRTARLRVGTELHWTYLFHLIRSSSFVQYILGGQTGLGVPHISGKQILAFQFPKPPLPTQQAIVEKLDALSEETKRLEAIYERKKAALAELKQALLQKAFAGEL
jgi:type I restriction enzyme S subunit